MQGTVVSYQAVVIDGGMWIKCTIITYFGMASYSSVRVEGSVVTNLSTIAYAGKRSDIYTSFPNFAVGATYASGSIPVFLGLLIS